jgi:hypothetical protein
LPETAKLRKTLNLDEAARPGILAVVSEQHTTARALQRVVCLFHIRVSALKHSLAVKVRQIIVGRGIRILYQGF